MNIICQQKFADLHDGDRIFYSASSPGKCKEIFEEIKNLDHEVILISGTEDHHVGKIESSNTEYRQINYIFDNVPQNVKYWFTQNNVTRRDNIIPIPLGMRNGHPSSKRPADSSGWDWVVGQHKVLENIYLNDNSSPTKFLYVNYCNRPEHRKKVTEICQEYLNSPHHEANLNYDVYTSHILDHECAMSPIGMGVDCYRIYEILYCKRIPITVKVGKIGEYYADCVPLSWTGTQYAPPQEEEYPIYTDLYPKFPIVMLDSIEELKDINHLKKLVEEQKNKEWDRNLLDFDYWKNLIYEYKNYLK